MQEGVKQAIAIYARTATDDAAGSGCERQVRAARRLAGDEIAVYADVARSGNDAARPELRRLLDAARAGHIARVLIHDVSRLARNPVLLSRILEELEAAGVVVESLERTPAHA